MSLVAIGACYLDTILTTPHYPGEDEKLRASNICRRRGGNCPNTLEVLQQLVAHGSSPAELSLNLVAVLPARSSAASQQIQAAFEPHVRMDHCIYRDELTEPASSYIFKSQASGSRTIVNYNELPEMNVDEFVKIAEALGSNDSWFHFEGRIPEVTLSCIHYLREQFPAVKISVEVEKPERPGLQQLAKEADVVFYSKVWAQGNGYHSAEQCIREQSSLTGKASLLCCTWGEYGAVALETATKELIHQPAYTAADFKIVDTIGAGDSFNAGMLYALLCRKDEWDLSQKLEFANRVAGLKVSQEGFAGLGRALD
ncbi:ketohexokinase [Aspergillus saccharolyticus JOP 1030-1]|uniref:Putative PfkB family kinase n=1 Tax=Aspergillus saccharolyticus JOP 1030-1 TaxID=1450539 RepID=A0A318ZTA5_9EURO|nr:putative PfkB family kinase [Aspergillus saccharolyticus JOP 1030-1]PYH49935.1 putative PfkB family kinase [Aspergillus saccharolyticus JOP 1030-1]